MIDAIVLLGLVLAWGVVLFPSIVRARSNSTHTSVEGFNATMQALRRHSDGRELMVPGQPHRIVDAPARHGTPTPVPSPNRPGRILERRREVFTRLLVASAATFTLAILFGGMTWGLFLVAGAATGGYVALLLQFKMQREEAKSVVHHLELVPDLPRANRSDEPLWREPVAVGAGYAPQPGAPGAPDDQWHPQAGIRVRRF